MRNNVSLEETLRAYHRNQIFTLNLTNLKELNGFPCERIDIGKRFSLFQAMTLSQTKRHTSSFAKRAHRVSSFRVGAIFLMLLAWFCANGNHLGLMQMVAWSQMTVKYSQESGFSQGLSRTFSAEEACNLCQIVQTATDSASKKDTSKKITSSSSRIHLFLSSSYVFFAPSEISWEQPFDPDRLTEIPLAIPTPPPRLRAVA
jgi:hypothetical protein